METKLVHAVNMWFKNMLSPLVMGVLGENLFKYR